MKKGIKTNQTKYRIKIEKLNNDIVLQ